MGFYVADTFSDALTRLPKQIREKVGIAQSKFNTNRNQPGLNFEKIHAADDDIYSIRVNQDYRIICKCPSEDKDIFLYVDKHDDAYQWAKDHTCSEDINGIMTVHTATAPKISNTGGKLCSRLSAFSDDDFSAIAVGPEYREQLRNKVFTKNHLLGFKDLFSEETYLILEYVIDGGTKDEALDIYAEFLEEVIPVPAIQDPPLFDYLDIDLAHIGVPKELIDLLKRCRTKDDFTSIQDKFPESVLQTLYALLDGEPIETIKKKITSESKDVVEGDIETVLNNPRTQQSIIKIESDEDFSKLLEEPMEKWRVFLHPDQRHIVEADYNGPARVIGGAGTGKTVIVVHRAKMLASKCKGDEKVLVTTFSRTLADDISARLNSICSAKELKRIEVNTLDSIAYNLAQRYVKYTKQLSIAWRNAQEKAKFYTFKESFYIAEWREVIQGQQIKSREEYRKALRIGRGDQRVDRAARDSIYTVMEYYKEYMKEKNWIDIEWAENESAELLKRNPAGKYKYILVDECQDFGAPALRLLRALAGKEHPNDLFLSGDARQRIYSGKTSLSSCGIYVRNRSTQLKVNYRTTREINDLSLVIQKGFNYDDLDNNPTDKDGNTSIRHGEAPRIQSFKTAYEELSAVAADIQEKIQQGLRSSEICVVAKTNKICDYYEEELSNYGIDTLRLLQDQPDDRSISGVRISTMHRVKGMEFDSMYAVSVNDGIMPFSWEYKDSNLDANARLDIRKKDANLLAVAITRARKSAWISSFGTPSMLLEKLT